MADNIGRKWCGETGGNGGTKVSKFRCENVNEAYMYVYVYVYVCKHYNHVLVVMYV